MTLPQQDLRVGALAGICCLVIFAVVTVQVLVPGPRMTEPQAGGEAVPSSEGEPPEFASHRVDEVRAGLAALASPARRALATPSPARVEDLLAQLFGPRWPAVRASLGPVRLAALEATDLSTLPSWEEVEPEVYFAGLVWIDERRGTWPGGLSDRWRDVERLDFRRQAFNREGQAIDPALDARLRELVRDYNGRIDRLAREFWDQVAVAYHQKWQRKDLLVPLPDPSAPGLDAAGLQVFDDPGHEDGVLIEVVASSEGWRVELPISPEDAPAADQLLGAIQGLEQERLEDVRGTIEAK